ncbi:LOB DOMAIN-CONTAINING PROTEIN 4-RELATED [Salix purpurea]|uniref:LOB DOMAIN-CONTAINING PROTEIN 4-RELATED n=1 Tax=Salix purpurea TaxID=77065 RepID=A0A9Q0UBH1_SALPP|nr:LOB DOMAIN-CONTAINING PROTEIN 4-RELATED [Salix purpurea]
MRNHEPRASSSCAACKLLKRRCTPSCIFAPYFRSDEPKKFAKVHKVFGASNVSKILNEVPEEQRDETVNSLAYEAEARLRDPVYGCIGAIALLQRRMVELQVDLAIARARLARYSASSPPMLNDHGSMIPTLAELPACESAFQVMFPIKNLDLFELLLPWMNKTTESNQEYHLPVPCLSCCRRFSVGLDSTD